MYIIIIVVLIKKTHIYPNKKFENLLVYYFIFIYIASNLNNAYVCCYERCY